MTSILAPLVTAIGDRNADATRDACKRVLKDHAKTAPTLIAEMIRQLREHGGDDALLAFYKATINDLPEALFPAIIAHAQDVTYRGNIRMAITMLELVSSRTPDDAATLQKIARRYQMIGQEQKGIELLKRILELAPNQPEGQLMYALARMIATRCKEGVEDYEWRFKVFTQQWRVVNAKRWAGEPLTGKTVYIWSEQGTGDVIMFTRFLHFFLKENPLQITMGVSPHMLPLMQRTYPRIRFVRQTPEPSEEEAQLYDYHLPIADALRYIMPRALPRDEPHPLVPNPALLAEVRNSLSRYGNVRKVGISWYTTNKESAIMRNVPLDQWGPILSTPNCVFFSLQHGDAAPQEVDRLHRERGYPVFIDIGFDPVRDIEKMIALTACMDEVISIQNTAGHFGGGLNIYTTVMVSRALDMAWAIKPCPWYASVHYENQEQPMVWEPVIERVAEGLRHRVKQAA